MQSINISMNKKLRNRTFIASTLLIVLGLIGVILPMSFSLVLSEFISILLVIAGFTVSYILWHNHRTSWSAWLKSFVLITLGLLLGFYPISGIAVLGLLLIIYFFLDGFASINFAFDMRPRKGWLWFLTNGVFSFLLAIIFLLGWPFSSVWLVGIFVGISLVFDGVALLSLGVLSKTTD